MVKLTACVIVKNEEKNIARWLEKMRNLTKDLVVVDTGSTDATVKIVESFGVKVHFFSWRKDFAAAKNFAIMQAKGEWIIFLDADEYFTDESIRNVRKCIERFHRDRKIDALVCKIINVDESQNQRYISEFFNLRIFRNDPMLRYKYPIHEMMERKNGPLGFFIIPSGVEIYHSGYSSDIIKGKLARNLKILHEEIDQTGEKPWHYRYLCECYFGLGDYEKAYHYARLHIEKGERSLGRDNSIHKRLLETMILLHKPETEVLAEIDHMIDQFPEDGEMLWYKGEYFFQKQYYRDAETILRDVIKRYENMPENNSDYSYTSLKGRWGAICYALGMIAECKGDADMALAYYQKGIHQYKYNAAILTGLINLSRAVPKFYLLPFLQNNYQETQTDVLFLLRVLENFPTESSYCHYLLVANKFAATCGQMDEMKQAIADGAYVLAAENLKKDLAIEYKELILCVLRQPSIADDAIWLLLPPLYQAVYRRICGEDCDLTPAARRIADEIKQSLNYGREEHGGSTDAKTSSYALCLEYMREEKFMQSLQVAAEILEKDPHNGDILYVVAYASYRRKDFAFAETAAQAALTNGTKYDAETYKLLGHIHYANMEYTKVVADFTLALACVGDLKNDFSASLAQGLAHIYRMLGDVEEAKKYYFLAHEWCKDQKEKLENYSSYLLCCHYQPTMLPKEIFYAHKSYRDLLSDVKPYCQYFKQAGKIRIGYLSADFRQHVLYRFYYALLAVYDRDSFTVVCYSIGETDEDTEKLKKLPDLWRNLQGKAYTEIAAAIYEDAIDILVDLGGHSANGGLPALAFKPAPVQITALGYFNTTGLDTVDYLLSDIHVDPPGVNDEYFTEKLIRLPHSHFCYTPAEQLPPPATAPYMRNGYVTFGSFNQYVKVTDEMLDAWREILARVPGSVLVLKAQPFGCNDSKVAAAKRLEDAGFDLRRVVLEKPSSDYMERYLDIDIALDTFPYPGGGTTCDALYMGVPVISMVGKRHGARFGYSILKNVGLEGLAVESKTAYVERAVGLAEDKELLNLLHQNLRIMMQKSPLMDKKGYMADVEKIYRELVRK